MKKIILMMAIAILIAGTASAQGWGRGWGPWSTPAETVSLSGTLQVQNGQIVFNSGTTVYFVPEIVRLVGFVEGVREGAQVSVEGMSYGNILHLTRLNVGGRSYDFPAAGFAQNNAPGIAPGAWCCLGYGGAWGGPGRHHNFRGRGRW